MSALEIAKMLIGMHEQMHYRFNTIEINGLYKRIVGADCIVLCTEYQDADGNWWEKKNYYRFEGTFNLTHYRQWEKQIVQPL